MPQGELRYLKISISGTVESEPYALDLSANLAAGDTILSSPAPVIEQYNTTGAPALTLTFIGVSGGQVQFRITGSGLTVGTLYSISVTAQTANGNTPIGSGGLRIIGSK